LGGHPTGDLPVKSFLVISALLLLPPALGAQSKQEKIAQAILHSKPLRLKAESGPTITLSTEKAQRYVLAVVEVAKKQGLKKDYLKTLSLQKGETHAEWATRLGRDTAVVRALKTQNMGAAEYVALGVTLHSAWEESHRRKPIAAVNPKALAWVKENDLALQALATVDGKHIPWPDGSVDGKGVKDRRIW
jgi:hypothetical protein